jgi:hypothetical protein
MCSGCVNCRNQATAFCSCGAPLTYSIKTYDRNSNTITCKECNKHWNASYVRKKTHKEVGVVYL